MLTGTDPFQRVIRSDERMGDNAEANAAIQAKWFLPAGAVSRAQAGPGADAVVVLD